MALVSMAFSLPTLCPPNLRRVNRYNSGKAYATVGKEASTSLGVRVTEGEGNLPKVVLTSATGSEADVYLFGGCVTSWKVANGKDLLFVRPDAVFNKKKPISGGLPHCFPQFGPGQIQQHGFARNLDWSIVDSENVEGNPVVTLELKDSTYSRSMWDYSFQALYKVILHTRSLSTELTITNTDNKPFSFNTALHSYFRASVTGASVKGLKGCKTLNKDPDPKNPLEGKEESRRAVLLNNMRTQVVGFEEMKDQYQTDPYFSQVLENLKELSISRKFPYILHDDCVYLDVPNELQLDNGLGDTISVRNTNWTDAVLWNPYLQMEACYKDFVCVENAKIGNVQLEPAQSWTATQHLSID